MVSNWRVHKYLSMIILGLTIAVLLGLGKVAGIDGISDTIMGFEWRYILAIGLGYVIWVFKTMLRA